MVMKNKLQHDRRGVLTSIYFVKSFCPKISSSFNVFCINSNELHPAFTVYFVKIN